MDLVGYTHKCTHTQGGDRETLNGVSRVCVYVCVYVCVCVRTHMCELLWNLSTRQVIRCYLSISQSGESQSYLSDSIY